MTDGMPFRDQAQIDKFVNGVVDSVVPVMTSNQRNAAKPSRGNGEAYTQTLPGASDPKTLAALESFKRRERTNEAGDMKAQRSDLFVDSAKAGNPQQVERLSKVEILELSGIVQAQMQAEYEFTKKKHEVDPTVEITKPPGAAEVKEGVRGMIKEAMDKAKTNGTKFMDEYKTIRQEAVDSYKQDVTPPAGGAKIPLESFLQPKDRVPKAHLDGAYEPAKSATEKAPEKAPAKGFNRTNRLGANDAQPEPTALPQDKPLVPEQALTYVMEALKKVSASGVALASATEGTAPGSTPKGQTAGKEAAGGMGRGGDGRAQSSGPGVNPTLTA